MKNNIYQKLQDTLSLYSWVVIISDGEQERYLLYEDNNKALEIYRESILNEFRLIAEYGENEERTVSIRYIPNIHDIILLIDICRDNNIEIIL